MKLIFRNYLVVAISFCTIILTSIIYSQLRTHSGGYIKHDKPRKDETLLECPDVPSGLVGRIEVVESNHSMVDVEGMHPELHPGGLWRPTTCTARHRVAIIVPYRDRERHLVAFLEHMHPFLQKQQLDYGIYVIEQTYAAPFNRAKLLNIGFVEASRRYDYQCYVFHDVDMLPENDKNMYSCPTIPRHMCVTRSITNYKLPYLQYFGGVVNLRKEHFEKVNGYSNRYFGWGVEDDDFYRRVIDMHEYYERPTGDIGRYRMLHHKKAARNPDRLKIFKNGRKDASTDGLNNLNYRLIETDTNPLYTRMLANFTRIY